MIRRLVIHPTATQAQCDSISTVAWELHGNDVKFIYRNGEDVIYHDDKKTFDAYLREGKVCSVPVVEDIEPWKAEVQRLNDELDRSVKAWNETAAQAARDREYYRGLVIRIGNLFGEAAKTCDDGSKSEDVLVAKVPELVEELCKEKNGGDCAYTVFSELYQKGRLRGFTAHTSGSQLRSFIASLDDEIAKLKSENHKLRGEMHGLQLSHDEFQSTWVDILDLCRSQGMKSEDRYSGKDSVLRHIRNQESAAGHLADDLKKADAKLEAGKQAADSVAKALGFVVPVELGNVLDRISRIRDERSSYLYSLGRLEKKYDRVEGAVADLKSAIASSLNANGEEIPLADTIYAAVRFIQSPKTTNRNEFSYIRSLWNNIVREFGMNSDSFLSYSDDIMNFIRSLKSALADIKARAAKELGDG